jgi:hypothetical protein
MHALAISSRKSRQYKRQSNKEYLEFKRKSLAISKKRHTMKPKYRVHLSWMDYWFSSLPPHAYIHTHVLVSCCFFSVRTVSRYELFLYIRWLVRHSFIHGLVLSSLLYYSSILYFSLSSSYLWSCVSPFPSLSLYPPISFIAAQGSCIHIVFPAYIPLTYPLILPLGWLYIHTP